MAEPMPARSAGPRRIAISFLGTRGDCQPYVALALGLKDRGHHVKAFSNAMHRDFVEAYGIDFAAFAPQRVKLADEDKKEFGADLFTNVNIREDLPRFAKEMRSFGPDILLASGLAKKFCFVTGAALGKPVVELGLQPTYPNRRRLSMGLPSFPPALGWANAAVQRLGVLYESHILGQIDGISQQVFGIRLWDGIRFRAFWDTVLRVPQPSVLVANPRRICEALYEYMPPNVRLTGYWVMDAERQLSAAGAGQFGGEDAKRELEAFIAAGEPPVYMGWGSMIQGSAKQMALLACGAARAAGRRAVVVGGWAQLSLEMLRAAAAAAGRPELAVYAEQNVLFVAKAPHEWLFPRCACTVHHGGSGTTATALRAGVPTVITPVLLDQFDYAEVVKKLGVGIGTRRLSRLKEADLGAAISAACNSEPMHRKAAELRDMLLAEDGIAVAAREIEKVLALHELGEFKSFPECVRERQKELNARPREISPAQLALGLAGAVAAYRRLRRGGLFRPRSAL